MTPNITVIKTVAKLAVGLAASMAGSVLVDSSTRELGHVIAGAMSAKAAAAAEATAETATKVK